MKKNESTIHRFKLNLKKSFKAAFIGSWAIGFFSSTAVQAQVLGTKADLVPKRTYKADPLPEVPPTQFFPPVNTVDTRINNSYSGNIDGVQVHQKTETTFTTQEVTTRYERTKRTEEKTVPRTVKYQDTESYQEPEKYQATEEYKYPVQQPKMVDIEHDVVSFATVSGDGKKQIHEVSLPQRDLIFVVDTSSSMGQANLSASREAIRKMLPTLAKDSQKVSFVHFARKDEKRLYQQAPNDQFVDQMLTKPYDDYYQNHNTALMKTFQEPFVRDNKVARDAAFEKINTLIAQNDQLNAKIEKAEKGSATRRDLLDKSKRLALQIKNASQRIPRGLAIVVLSDDDPDADEKVSTAATIEAANSLSIPINVILINGTLFNSVEYSTEISSGTHGKLIRGVNSNNLDVSYQEIISFASYSGDPVLQQSIVKKKERIQQGMETTMATGTRNVEKVRSITKTRPIERVQVVNDVFATDHYDISSHDNVHITENVHTTYKGIKDQSQSQSELSFQAEGVYGVNANSQAPSHSNYHTAKDTRMGGAEAGLRYQNVATHRSQPMQIDETRKRENGIETEFKRKATALGPVKADAVSGIDVSAHAGYVAPDMGIISAKGAAFYAPWAFETDYGTTSAVMARAYGETTTLIGKYGQSPILSGYYPSQSFAVVSAGPALTFTKPEDKTFGQVGVLFSPFAVYGDGNLPGFSNTEIGTAVSAVGAFQKNGFGVSGEIQHWTAYDRSLASDLIRAQVEVPLSENGAKLYGNYSYTQAVLDPRVSNARLVPKSEARVGIQVPLLRSETQKAQ